jgi:hypothetical protein
MTTPRDDIRRLNEQDKVRGVGTPIPTDSERIARPMNWSGPLTVENARAIKDRIEKILGGQRYSVTTTYVGQNQYTHQVVKTSSTAREFELSVVPFGEDDDGREMAMITIPDSTGLWLIDTTIPDRLAANMMTYENVRLHGAYFTLTEDQVQFETRNHDGGLRVHTLAVQRDWNLEHAAREVLKAYDAMGGTDPEGGLAEEIRWLRESLASGR